MVIDTSAIIALLFGESEAETFAKAIAYADKCSMSAFTALETAIVTESKKGEAGFQEFDLLIRHTKIKIIPMNARQFEIARLAWRTYGRYGFRH